MAASLCSMPSSLSRPSSLPLPFSTLSVSCISFSVTSLLPSCSSGHFMDAQSFGCDSRWLSRPAIRKMVRLVVFCRTPARDRRINFGRHKGELLGSLPLEYLSWMVRSHPKWADLAQEVLDERDCHPSNNGRKTPTRRFSKEEDRKRSVRSIRQMLVKDYASESIEQQYGHRLCDEDLDRLDRQGIASLLQGGIALSEGKRVHAHIIRSGHHRDTFLGNLLLSMYGKCGALEDARSVFDKMHQRNVVSWTAMIATYSQHGHGKEALQLFREMQQQGVKPDKITFISILGACAIPAALAEGKAIHACIADGGFESDLVVGSALVNMYGKCGAVEDARAVFDTMHQHNVVSWTAMITAYSQHGHSKEALQLFQEMQRQGVKPNKITFVSILAACAIPAGLAEGKAIHACIVDGGFESDAAVGSALVNMYGKCGALEDARSVFDQIHQRDVLSWNAMMAAYSQHGHGKEALQLFQEMQQQCVKPNKITFISILGACAIPAGLAEGKAIHACIVDGGFESDVVVGSALVSMYGKCGALEDARSVFDKIHQRDVVSWTAMITAYSQHGHGKEALRLFRQMQQEGMEPDEVTFVCLLSACSHAGLVEEGHYFFVSMIKEHGITPTLKHYSCMIDLLGRAGQLDDAENMIYNMPLLPDAQVWTTLLGACRIHGDVKRGERAAEHLFDLDPQNASAYVLLSNIYAADGRWDDVEKVREAMVQRGVKKLPGCSWIEVDNRVHEFFVADRCHPKTEAIYAELERLSRQMREAGFMPDTKLVLCNVKEELKEHMLCGHSEKLAIAFGLVSTPPGTPLCITKNLRVCPDCHTATRFLSKILRREIIVRDSNRFHHFKQGVCSCGDYW